jgi:ABC-type antimicrobial peptide transport system permease subunit
LIGAGLTVGFGVALIATRLVATFLYGLQPNDPSTLGAAGIVLTAVALLAGYLPARRASKVDPMTALRDE